MTDITHNMLAKGQGKKYPGTRELVLNLPRKEGSSVLTTISIGLRGFSGL